MVEHNPVYNIVNLFKLYVLVRTVFREKTLL